MFKCQGKRCRNSARSKPYAEGYFCRQCHREMNGSRVPERHAPSQLRGAAARRTLEAKTPGTWLRPATGEKAMTPKPPGPLPKLRPGWWEINDRW